MLRSFRGVGLSNQRNMAKHRAEPLSLPRQIGRMMGYIRLKGKATVADLLDGIASLIRDGYIRPSDELRVDKNNSCMSHVIGLEMIGGEERGKDELPKWRALAILAGDPEP